MPTASAATAVWLDRARRDTAKLAARVSAFCAAWDAAKVAPHLLLPLFVCVLVASGGAWWSWLLAAGAWGLRHQLRAGAVNGAAGALMESGLRLLPADDNSVVEDFVSRAQASDVRALVESLCVGAEVTLLDLTQEPFARLNGAKGVVKGFHKVSDTDTRVVVAVDGDPEGKVKLFGHHNLSQTADLWGKSYTFTRYRRC